MNKKKKKSDVDFNQDRLLFWGAMVAVFLSLLYLAITIIKPGLPAGHDIAPHAIRLKILNEALKQGQFPARWAEGGIIDNLAGMPLFNFYPGGFYYLTSAISIVISSLTESIKVTTLLLWWAGSGFMFLFLRRFGTLSAIFGALVFAFTPYLALDVFVRAAYPEFAAIVFSVGIFWATDRLLTTGKSWYALPLSISLALIVLSHLPTLVIITPVIGAYILFLILRNQASFSSLVRTAIAYILGIGLVSFYLLPSIFEINLIQKQHLTSGSYDYKSHFVLPQQLIQLKWGYGISVAGPNDGMSFQIGFLNLLIILAAILVIIYIKISKKISKKHLLMAPYLLSYLLFWLGATAYAIFFMHDISFSFWENLQPLAFVQYPWRFLMIIPLATAILAGLLLSVIKNLRYQAGIIVASTVLIFVFYQSFLKPSVFLPNNYFDIDSPDWQTSQGVQTNFAFEPGYLPVGVEKRLPRNNLPRWEIVSGQGSLKPKDPIKFHEADLLVEAQNPLVVSFNTHYFPGWKVYVDNQEASLDTNNLYVFMRFAVPGGIHSVQAKFTDTLVRSAANTITILSLLASVLWIAYTYRLKLLPH